MHVEARSRRSLPVLRLPPAGQRHQGGTPAPPAPTDLACRLVPVHSGHSKIEQDDLGRKRLGDLERLHPVVGGADVVPGELELQRQRLDGIDVVVGHQDAARTHDGRTLRFGSSARRTASQSRPASGRRTTSSVPWPGP